jgi:hypothetical protein
MIYELSAAGPIPACRDKSNTLPPEGALIHQALACY